MTTAGSAASVSRISSRRDADSAPEQSEAAVEWIDLGGHRVVRVTLPAGWQHAIHGHGVTRRQRLCSRSHHGIVVQGRSRISTVDGSETVVGPGDLYAVVHAHDWRVEGDEPVIVVGLGEASPTCIEALAHPR